MLILPSFLLSCLHTWSSIWLNGTRRSSLPFAKSAAGLQSLFSLHAVKPTHLSLSLANFCGCLIPTLAGSSPGAPSSPWPTKVGKETWDTVQSVRVWLPVGLDPGLASINHMALMSHVTRRGGCLSEQRHSGDLDAGVLVHEAEE